MLAVVPHITWNLIEVKSFEINRQRGSGVNNALRWSPWCVITMLLGLLLERSNIVFTKSLWFDVKAVGLLHAFAFLHGVRLFHLPRVWFPVFHSQVPMNFPSPGLLSHTPITIKVYLMPLGSESYSQVGCIESSTSFNFYPEHGTS